MFACFKKRMMCVHIWVTFQGCPVPIVFTCFRSFATVVRALMLCNLEQALVILDLHENYITCNELTILSPYFVYAECKSTLYLPTLDLDIIFIKSAIQIMMYKQQLIRNNPKCMSVSVLIVCKPANERNMLKKFNKLHPNYYTKSKINRPRDRHGTAFTTMARH